MGDIHICDPLCENLAILKYSHLELKKNEVSKIKNQTKRYATRPCQKKRIQSREKANPIQSTSLSFKERAAMSYACRVGRKFLVDFNLKLSYSIGIGNDGRGVYIEM